MVDRECGGCKGLGAHIRWCPTQVGYTAKYLGPGSEMIENLADTVGGNDPGLANILYHAAGELKQYALMRAERFKETGR